MSTDGELIRRARGNPRAFAELYDRHARAITRYAMRRVGPDGADDIVSETFLTAYRKLGRFDDSFETALPWLFGIATKHIHKARAQEHRQLLAYARTNRMDAILDDHLGAIDEREDAARRVKSLSASLAKLSVSDRDTLLLYAWGDLTYDGVAGALGVPVGTVRSRLNRVRRILSSAQSPTAKSVAAGE